MPISYTFGATRGVGFPGQIAELRDYEGITRRSLEAGLPIPFGVVVIASTAANGSNGVTLPRGLATAAAGGTPAIPAMGAAAFAGVTTRMLVEGGQYAVNDVFSVMRRGTMYVRVEDAVTDAMILQPGIVRIRTVANGGNTQLGAFRASSDTTNVALLNGARFLIPCAAGGISIVEIPDNVTLTAGT